MIILRAGIVTKLKSGKNIIYRRKILKKWSNEKLYAFDFDVFNPDEWKLFLRNDFRLSNGKKLPYKTVYDEPITYEVYIAGIDKNLREKACFYSGSSRSPYLNLFPGYVGDDEKHRNEKGKIPVKERSFYGRIDK